MFTTVPGASSRCGSLNSFPRIVRLTVYLPGWPLSRLMIQSTIWGRHIPEASLKRVERLDEHSVFVHIRNDGDTVLRIVRYSIDRFAPVVRVPLIISPGKLGTLTATRDLSLTSSLEHGVPHEITVWDETGWAFTFPLFRV